MKLADRSLMPGDVVRRVSGKDSQRGYCRSVNVMADIVVIGTNTAITSVRSSELIPLQV